MMKRISLLCKIFFFSNGESQLNTLFIVCDQFLTKFRETEGKTIFLYDNSVAKMVGKSRRLAKVGMVRTQRRRRRRQRDDDDDEEGEEAGGGCTSHSDDGSKGRRSKNVGRWT